MIGWLALAHAAEYRRVELEDGRVLVAEVMQTDEVGLALRLPQGRVWVRFEDVIRIDPVDDATFVAQRPLTVLVLPFPDRVSPEIEPALRVALGAMPWVRVLTLREVAERAPGVRVAALASCGLDASCVVAQGGESGADVVVMGGVAPPGYTVPVATVASVFLAAPRAQRRLPAVPASGAGPAAVALLGLDPEVPKDATAAVPPPAPPAKSRPPDALALVPVPGLPQWSRGDVPHALLATGIAVPTTVGIVAAAGAGSTRAHEVVIIGAIGWWAACVVVNRAIPVVVSPTDGGATVVAGGRF